MLRRQGRREVSIPLGPTVHFCVPGALEPDSSFEPKVLPEH